MNTDNDYINTNIEEFFAINQKLGIKRTYAEDHEQYPSYVKDNNRESVFIEKPTKAGVSISLQLDGV